MMQMQMSSDSEKVTGNQHQTKPAGNQQEPQTKGAGNQQEFQTKAVGNQQELQTKGAGIQQEPQTKVAGIQQEPQTKVAGIQQEPQTKVAGIQQEPQTKVAGKQEFQTIYQSHNFIVVNKNYDVKIDGEDDDHPITIATQLAETYPELVDPNLINKFRFAHRLDYSTSGVICIALNKKAAADAFDKFAKRLVTKEYLALVRGHVSEDSITMDKAVYPNPEEEYSHMMRIVDEATPADAKTKSARTELMVMQRGLYDGDAATKVRLCPKTGRRHQLRVHCHSIGYPIVGDYTYSMRQDVKPYRMMLHSHKLIIPAKTEVIDVIAPDPFLTELDPLWQPYASPR